MIGRLGFGGVLTLAFVLCPTGRAQRVLNEVRPQQAYVGQEIRYYVQVQGAKTAECELDSVDGLTFELEDQGITNQSTRVSIINGRREVRETSDYTLVYRVIAARSGRFVIPPPRVTVGGRTLTGGRCSLLVEDPARDDRAAVELRVEPPAVVLGQDGRFVVDVFLKHLPEALRARDPLQLYGQSQPFSFFDQGTPPPTLTLPWLANPPQGLGPIDLESWVRSRQVQRGFRLEGVRGGRFLETGEVEDVERDDVDGRPARYRRYRFTFPFRGEVAGTHELAPAVLQGKLVAQNGGQFVWRDAFVPSQRLRFEVLEPPLEGRPETFRGAVGVFTFEMEPPTPTIVGLGDSVYLTLVVEGQGFLKGVGIDLATQLGERFRVERVGVTDSLPAGAERPPGFPGRPGNWRQWDFKVYPIDTGVTALPELAFSWYDPGRHEYATATTAAVPITVRPADAVGTGVVVGTGAAAAGRKDIELVPTSALSANVSDLNLLADQSPRPWTWLAILAALPAVYVLLAFFVRRGRRLRDDPALLRRRRAAARANARLREARAASGTAAIVGAHSALRGYVADLTDREEEALTSEDLTRWIGAQGVEADLCAQVQQLSDAVEAAAYGGGAGGHAATLLDGLERVFRGAARAGAALIAMVTLCAGVPAQDVELFNQAQAAFEARDFEGAAHAYVRMLEEDYENGYVLYNLGNAWLRSGELGRAIAAYRRASLFLPGDANLEVNLRRALEARRTPLSSPEQQSVLDYVMFWRPHLPFRTEVQLAVLAGALAFGLAVARLLSGRRLSAVKWTAVLLVAASILLASSAVLDYRMLVARDRAVVVEDGTVLRTGPGETFEAGFEQPLGEGAELEVQARRDGWLQVLAGGQYEGWIVETAAVRW